MMSVPPEMDDNSTRSFTLRYTYSKLSGESGEPVERIVLSAASLCVSRGFTPILAVASIHLALVPKTLMPVSSARFHSTLPSGHVGEPSYSTTAAPTLSEDTSQFHIIHPQVV